MKEMNYPKCGPKSEVHPREIGEEPRYWKADRGDGASERAAKVRAPMKIMLAEDDDDMRYLLAGALRAEGFEVLEVRDGDELIERLTCDLLLGDGSCSVDLIITDVRMPGISGLSVLEGLRRVDGWTPVIVITAFGDETVHAEAQRLGAVAVLDKPFDVGYLRHLAHIVTAS